MGEFGATITFVSNIPGQTQTLPSAIYAFLQVPGGEASAVRLVAGVDRGGDDRAARVRVRGRTRGTEDPRNMSLSVALRHRFPGFALDVAFEAPPGVTALFGRSGSGKTTVVNAVAGLLRPDRGRVAIDGWELFDTDARRWLPPHRRRVGYVFQEGRLFPHLSVRQNLRYGQWFAGGAEGGAGFDRVVEMLGIGALLDRRPGALSGGEKQRVAIGRALLSHPRLLLMDEPLARARRGAQGRDPALSGAAARRDRDPHRLCQSYGSGGGAAGDDGRGTRRRPAWPAPVPPPKSCPIPRRS